jgi:nicotinate-nucleotide--dimethylbenzimidazole phosphoribosyltransferase
MDASVLTEVAAAVEPVDEAARAAARARLTGANGGGLGRFEQLAVELAGMRRRVDAPVARKTLVAVAADLGDTDAAAIAALRSAAAGRAPVAVLARAASAQMMLVDAGLRGAAEADLGAGVLQLRVADGAADPASGATMTEEQALTSVQTGIALALSLASEGVDVLALGDLAPAGRAAARGLVVALAAVAPLAALARAGGFQHGVLGGLCIAGAAMHVPVVLDGPSADAAGRLAARLAPAAAGYQIPAASLADFGIARGDGSGAAAALPVLDVAARLARELA